MTVLDIAPTPLRSQPTFGKSFAPIRAATLETRRDANRRLVHDNLYYKKLLADDKLRGGGRVFGKARNFSPVPAESRRVRRSIAAFIAYLGRAAIARLIDLLAAICRAVAPPVESDYRWQGDTNVYPFDTQVYEFKSSITAPLVEAFKRKEQAAMVIQHPTADIQPNSHTVPVAANGTRVWASASPTSGLSSVIDTKREAETLAAAKVNHPEWLIGDSKRWNGAQ